MSTRLDPLTEADFATVIDLGRRIWLEYYVPMLGQAQVDYMMGQRFTPDYLRSYLNRPDRWFDVLRTFDESVGYCSYVLTNRSELKLEQLYLLPELHGRGFGKLMMARVEGRARELRCSTMMLQVNKRNRSSIAVYTRAGFTVREEAVFDIGGGFVMDDFVMQKTLT